MVVQESDESLIRYLEQLAGRKFLTREAIHNYLKELWADEARRSQAANRRRIVRETLLLVMLLGAGLNYYYWDVSLQIAQLRSVQVFVPVPSVGASAPGSSPRRAAR